MNDRVRSAGRLGIRGRRAPPARSAVPRRARCNAGASLRAPAGRLISTIESTALAQNVTVHVVRVGDKYFLVGGGTGRRRAAGGVAGERDRGLHRIAPGRLARTARDPDAPLRALQEIMTQRRLAWILGAFAAVFVVIAALAPAFAQTIPGPYFADDSDSARQHRHHAGDEAVRRRLLAADPAAADGPDGGPDAAGPDDLVHAYHRRTVVRAHGTGHAVEPAQPSAIWVWRCSSRFSSCRR